jgi:hypothetical protein
MWQSAKPLLVLLLLGTACAETLHVDPGQPRPIIDLAPKHGVRLHLDMHKVADELRLESGAGEVQVHGWRGTLAFGYLNGLRQNFPPVKGVPVLTVELLQALPIYRAAADPTAGVAVQLQYQARLLDAAGNVLRKSEGVVTAKNPGTDRLTLTRATANAVENMYEQIAGDLLAGL